MERKHTILKSLGIHESTFLCKNLIEWWYDSKKNSSSESDDGAEKLPRNQRERKKIKAIFQKNVERAKTSRKKTIKGKQSVQK